MDNIQDLINKAPKFKNSEIVKIDDLQGDASSRQYKRIFLKKAPQESLIVMLLDQGIGPKAAGDNTMNQNDSFVELTKYFHSNNIRVPEIYLDNRKESILLIEDTGKEALWNYAFDDIDDSIKLNLYKSTINLLKQIQESKKDENSIAFKRFLEFEQYREEAGSLIDNYLIPNNAAKSHIEKTNIILDNLCESISSHPKVLIHRDFMPWNIQVMDSKEICMIDYQDSLIASSEYDITSLIHDRDADFAIGEDLCRDIAKYYKDTLNKDNEFETRYYEMLIHRNLRLTGHFNLLTNNTGKPQYKGWVPGCLKRLGSILGNLSDFSDLIDILSKHSDKVYEGAKKPYTLINS